MRKVCRVCKRLRALSQFNKNRARKDGLDTRCRDCNAAHMRAYAQTERGKERLRASTVRHRTGPIGSCKEKARLLIKAEVKAGRLCPASEHVCECCTRRPAAEWHHDSYRTRGHWLKVRALCKVCHDRWHRENKAEPPSPYTQRKHGRR